MAQGENSVGFGSFRPVLGRGSKGCNSKRGSRRSQKSQEGEELLRDGKVKKLGPPPLKNGVDYVNALEEDQMELFGYQPDPFLNFLTWCGIFCTGGLLRLVFHWRPHWMLYCTHRQRPLDQASKVLLVDQYQQIFVECVQTVKPSDVNVSSLMSMSGTMSSFTNGPIIVDHLVELEPGGTVKSTDKITYFNNKHLKYIWDPEKKAFFKLRGFDKGIPCSYFYQQKGLPVLDQLLRRVLYGDNHINVDVQPLATIFFREVLEPFYCFQVFSMIVWYLDKYVYYASCIIVMSVLSLATSIYQIRKNQMALKNTVHGSDVVTVKRGKDVHDNIPSEHLVPGDVIVIPRHGCVMQCDAVLIGGNCIVNESMLTGESVPVVKTPLPNPVLSSGVVDKLYHPKEHARHTLFGGTKVIQTRYYGNDLVEAVVIRTGFQTSKGELVRSIMHPKPVDFKLNRHINIFLMCLGAVASVGLIYTVILKIMRNVPGDEIAIRALDLVTIVIPPALPAAMTIGVVFAQSRLKKAFIYCISPRSINISGCINCFCFDKTGTLTEDGLDMWGAVPVSDKRFQEPVKEVALLPQGPLLIGLASCHSLTMIDRQLTGDPLDLKMFEATNWMLEEPDIDDTTKYDIITPTVVRPKQPDIVASSENVETEPPFEVGIVRELPFSSSLQRMSVVTRILGSSHFDVYTKGAPETIASLCKPDTVPSEFSDVLMKYTQQGYRVLALAHRPFNVSYAKVHRISREDIECNLTFAGLLVMENRLKPQTTNIIRTLKSANIRPIMVTGDNMLTALSVARDCQMIESHHEVVILSASSEGLSWQYSEVPYKYVQEIEMHSKDVSIHMKNDRTHIAVTGKTFAVLREKHPEVLKRVAVSGTVFARMAPEQKQQLVELLIEMGYYVGMCGDGANDCGALKAAHAGISLSETEASVASPFTSKIADITCVPKLIKEGRAALVTSFGVLKYMACYSLTQFTSVTILYQLHSNLTDLEFLYIDLFLITLFAALFGRTEPYPVLNKTPPPASLIGLTPLSSVFSQMVLVIISQFSAILVLWQQPWYVANVNGDGDKDLGCHDNVAIFFVSVFQYITLAVIFSRGAPYRKSIFTNYLFLASLIIMSLFTFYLVLSPPHVLISSFELTLGGVSMDFKIVCVSIALSHFAIAYLLENYIIQGFVFKHCQGRCHQTFRPYKELEEEIMTSTWLPPSESSTVTSALSDHTCALEINGSKGTTKNDISCHKFGAPQSNGDIGTLPSARTEHQSNPKNLSASHSILSSGVLTSAYHSSPELLGVETVDQSKEHYTTNM